MSMDGSALEIVLLLVGVWAAIIIVFVLAFLPTIVAVVKHHPDYLWILLVNLFLGGTVVGWIFALVWAFSPNWSLEKFMSRRNR